MILLLNTLTYAMVFFVLFVAAFPPTMLSSTLTPPTLGLASSPSPTLTGLMVASGVLPTLAHVLFLEALVRFLSLSSQVLGLSSGHAPFF